jgi:hypothetical protein
VKQLQRILNSGDVSIELQEDVVMSALRQCFHAFDDEFLGQSSSTTQPLSSSESSSSSSHRLPFLFSLVELLCRNVFTLRFSLHAVLKTDLYISIQNL